MKEAEKALRDELYTKVAEKFKAIIKISAEMGDNIIKSEFEEKLEILTSKIPATSTESKGFASPELISAFINELKNAPKFIIKDPSEAIDIFGAKEVSVPEVFPSDEHAPIYDIAVPKIPGAAISQEKPTMSPKPPIAVPVVKPPVKGPPIAKPITKSPIKGPPTAKPRPAISPPPIAIKKPIVRPISHKTPPPKTITAPPTAKLPSPLSARKVAPVPIKPVTGIPKPLDPNPISAVPPSSEFSDIEEEIKKMGSVEDQLKELKDILSKEQQKKMKT